MLTQLKSAATLARGCASHLAGPLTLLGALVFLGAAPPDERNAPSVHDAAPSKAQLESRAFALFEDAREAYTTHRYKVALSLLQRALDLSPKALILVKKADTLVKLGRLEEAMVLYSSITATHKRMDRRLEQAQQRLSALLTEPVPVAINSDKVVGATIFVDEVDTGHKTPAVVLVKRGIRKLRLSKEAHMPQVIDAFKVHGQGPMTLTVSLEPAGQLSVEFMPGSAPSTQALVNGRPLNSTATPSHPTPSVSIMLPVGEHVVLCRRQDGLQTRHPVTVRATRAQSVHCNLPPMTTKAPPIASWISLGSGLVIGGTGVTLLLASDNDSVPGSVERITGPLLIGAGIAAVITAVALFAESRHPLTSNDIQSTVNIHLSHQGVGASLSF